MKRPVAIITGFLGSGKTTLLSRLISGMEGVAVLVNEFGEVGLDHHLIRQVNERTTLLGNGCVCCTRREDLVESLLELLAMEQRGEVEKLGRVVVETTGLADPAPILFTVFEHPVLRHHFEIDRVVATVDAVNGDMHLDRNPESVKQISAADFVVVTKQDIATEARSLALEARLREVNPAARILRPDADIAVIFDEAVIFRDAPKSTSPSHPGETDSVSLTFDGAVDWAAFGVWLSMLLHARGEEVLRVKGMLDVGEDEPVVINGVQHTIHPPQHLESWPDEDRRSRLVFITRGVTSAEIFASLEAFAGILGASPRSLHAGAESRR